MELTDTEDRLPPGNRRGRRQPNRDHPEVPHDVWTVEHGEGLHFSFAFRGTAGVLAQLAGCRSDHGVDLAGGRIRIRYGPWLLDAPLDDVVAAEVTGPYHLVKVAGTPHVSLADRGITFATNTDFGVCLRFRSPVPALLPTGLLRHPAATVTVADPTGLESEIRRIVEARGGTAEPAMQRRR